MDKHTKFKNEALAYCWDPREGIELGLEKQVRRQNRRWERLKEEVL